MLRLDGVEGREREILEERIRIGAFVGGGGHGRSGAVDGDGRFAAAVETEGEGSGPERAREGFRWAMRFGGGDGEEAAPVVGIEGSRKAADGEGASERSEEHHGGYEEEAEPSSVP